MSCKTEFGGRQFCAARQHTMPAAPTAYQVREPDLGRGSMTSSGMDFVADESLLLLFKKSGERPSHPIKYSLHYFTKQWYYVESY